MQIMDLSIHLLPMFWQWSTHSRSAEACADFFCLDQVYPCKKVPCICLKKHYSKSFQKIEFLDMKVQFCQLVRVDTVYNDQVSMKGILEGKNKRVVPGNTFWTVLRNLGALNWKGMCHFWSVFISLAIFFKMEGQKNSNDKSMLDSKASSCHAPCPHGCLLCLVRPWRCHFISGSWWSEGYHSSAFPFILGQRLRGLLSLLLRQDRQEAIQYK